MQGFVARRAFLAAAPRHKAGGGRLLAAARWATADETFEKDFADIRSTLRVARRAGGGHRGKAPGRPQPQPQPAAYALSKASETRASRAAGEAGQHPYSGSGGQTGSGSSTLGSTTPSRPARVEPGRQSPAGSSRDYEWLPLQANAGERATRVATRSTTQPSDHGSPTLDSTTPSRPPHVKARQPTPSRNPQSDDWPRSQTRASTPAARPPPDTPRGTLNSTGPSRPSGVKMGQQTRSGSPQGGDDWLRLQARTSGGTSAAPQQRGGGGCSPEAAESSRLAHVKTGQQALDVLRRTWRAGREPDPMQPLIGAALELQRVGVLNETCYAFLFDVIGEKRVRSMRKIFDGIPSRDLTLDLVNRALWIEAGAGDAGNRVRSVFREKVQDLGFMPNVATYNALLRHLSKRGDRGAFRALVTSLAARQVNFDLQSFNLIASFAPPGDAAAILAEMRHRLLSPTAETFEMLVVGLRRHCRHAASEGAEASREKEEAAAVARELLLTGESLPAPRVCAEYLKLLGIELEDFEGAVAWYRTCARKLTQDSTGLLLALLAVSEAACGSVLVDDSRKSTLLDVVTSEFLLSQDKGYRDPTLWVATLNVFVAARDEDRVNELLQWAHARKPKNLAFLQRRLTAFLAEMRSSETSRPTAASASKKAAQSAATREVVAKCR
ncbi:hypothetical protein DIPPA_10309 [Diplonema papillatum]|nr:hypothetical protein DIPPA_10309 [Diplonema papillatum]